MLADLSRNWPGYLLTAALALLYVGVAVQSLADRAQRWDGLLHPRNDFHMVAP